MQNKEKHTVYAGFFPRLAAFLVDSMIVGVGLWMIRIVMWVVSLGAGDIFSRDFIFDYSALDILLYLLKLCYFVLLTYFTGATLGKKLFHLRVVSSENRKCTFFEIAFRESVGRFLSGLILFVGYIMVGVDKKKRGLHDLLSDTLVVYAHQVVVSVPAPVMVQRQPYAVPFQGMPPVSNPPAPMAGPQAPVSEQREPYPAPAPMAGPQTPVSGQGEPHPAPVPMAGPQAPVSGQGEAQSSQDQLGGLD